jgi:hypothetical protein
MGNTINIPAKNARFNRLIATDEVYDKIACMIPKGIGNRKYHNARSHIFR